MRECGLPDPSDFCPDCNYLRCRCKPEPRDDEEWDAHDRCEMEIEERAILAAEGTR